MSLTSAASLFSGDGASPYCAAATASAGAVYPASLAEVATFMGFANAPDSAWRTNSAAGATDIGGTNDLTGDGSPATVDDPLLGLGVDFGGGGSAGLDAASDAVFDIGSSTSFAAIMVMTWDAYSGVSQEFARKRAAGAPGYLLRADADGVLRTLSYDSSSNSIVTSSLSTYADGEPFVVAFGRDMSLDAGKLFLATDRESKAGSAAAFTGSLSGAGVFTLGSAVAPSQDFSLFFAAVWTGEDAEGITQAHLQALKAAMGF